MPNLVDPSRRVLLQGALAAAFVRQARAADVERFALGIASGWPTPDGVVLWTRLTGPDLPERVDEVRWEVAHDEAFARIAARGGERAERASAHSVHAEVAGLEPGRWYFYRFEALGQRSAVGRTRTLPAPAAIEPLRFAIASCQRYDHGRYAAWRDAAESPLDLVLFLGDYIYEYATPANAQRVRRHDGGPLVTLDDYRARYAQYKSDAQLQAAHRHAPWLTVWDDHEVDNDYAGERGQALAGPAFLARRAAAYQAYWEHMPLPRAMRPNGPDARVHARRDWGALARIHALDDRQYRDPQACTPPGRGGSSTVLVKECPDLLDPRRTLLGAAQERWLAEGWSAAHPWNLLAQQTLMARFSWRDPRGDDGPMAWTDGWDGYPLARRRLLQTVADRRVPNVVVLGGDVHANYVADLKIDFDDDRAPPVATEFCGTSIASEGLAQPRLDSALRWNPHIRHGRSDERGYVRFTLDARELRAELRSVADPLDAASAVRTAARFVVEAGRPGARPA